MNKSIFIHPEAVLSALESIDENQFLDNRRKTVGCILGSTRKRILSCNSSFKVPFEEDKSIWFIDHSFIDKMLEMHKKINKRETLLGWFSFCNNIMPNDQVINDIFYSYTEKPLFFLLWVDKFINGLVLETYSVKKVCSDTTNFFHRKKVTVGMLESEVIGIHQVLRGSEKWCKNFRSNILTTWFQTFTSFSKFFRKLFKYKIVLHKYKNLKRGLFLTKKIEESINNSRFGKNRSTSGIMLLYFLNILKLTMYLENNLYSVIL